MAVTVASLCRMIVQVVPVQPPVKPPNAEVPTGVAVRVTGVPAGKLATHEISVLAQLSPEGVLFTVPIPVPEKSSVRTGSPPPPPPVVLVKQTTFAVMYPVTIAPEADRPLVSAFVFTVAEIRVPPHGPPVTVIRPVEFTVTMAGVFEFQMTWSVMSLVTGGWTNVPRARS